MGNEMKIPKKQYESNLLRGADLKDSILVVISGAEPITFDEGEETERTTTSLSVAADVLGAEPKSFALGMRQTKVLVDAFGDETANWVGKEIRLTPVPSQTPNGKQTTSIAITVPQK